MRRETMAVTKETVRCGAAVVSRTSFFFSDQKQIPMRILVTGGAGFVGSAIIRRIVEEGHHSVISLDNYSSGKDANHVEGATYIHAPTWEINAHAAAIGKPDLIFHFGEFSRVVPSLKEPDLCLKSNQ